MMHYFYTDPLAAAWMAKHFGMKMAIPDGKQGWTLNQLIIAFQIDSPIHIHPDSLPLLEPRDGDINIKGLVYMHCSFHNKMSWVDLHCGNYCEERGQTIRRNGLPFMWPESEAT